MFSIVTFILISSISTAVFSQDGLFSPTNAPQTPTQRTTTYQNQQTNSITPRQPPAPLDDYSVCGEKVPRRDTKINAVRIAKPGNWPWMVALGYLNASNPKIQFECGASLISNRWVLTAAHCVKNTGNLTLTTARLGDLDLNDDTSDGVTPQDILIDEIIPHPNYSASPVTDDIALLRLKTPVTFHQNLRPICIQSNQSNEFYAEKNPFVSGWGANKWGGPSTTVLQDAQVGIVDLKICAHKYSSNNKTAVIDDRVLCAGADRENEYKCIGDSGGPLITPVFQGFRFQFFLAGIASVGITCADVNYPGVYTRVAQYTDWIRSISGV